VYLVGFILQRMLQLSRHSLSLGPRSFIPEGRDTISPTVQKHFSDFEYLIFLRFLYARFGSSGKSHLEVRLTGLDVSKQSNVFFFKGSEVIAKRRSHNVPRKVVV
jgi:hypothetical protein